MGDGSKEGLRGFLSQRGFLCTIEAFVAVAEILGWVGTRWIGKRYQELGLESAAAQ